MNCKYGVLLEGDALFVPRGLAEDVLVTVVPISYQRKLL
jgi:hypothetical protein